MKSIRLFLPLLFVATVSLASAVRGAESVSVKAILISASNESGESDGRLAASARGVLVHTNPEHTASKPLPDDLRARLEASIVA